MGTFSLESTTMMMTRNTLALLSCMLTLHVGEAVYTNRYRTDWFKAKRAIYKKNHDAIKKSNSERRRLADSKDYMVPWDFLGLRPGDDVVYYNRKFSGDKWCRGTIQLTSVFFKRVSIEKNSK